ncbi:hypothetical protein SAMN05216386_0485 [Nitrosospira briensis]|uniref:Phage terminase, small subunit, putative, P27 family n=1 Tax=Nitrosospira briensis TaxID=35799 RepID=A0A1I4Y3G6_9PROT|nr:hypothetical protein [Nitrosospira briensis]SFN32525.1 hypothetical protein SAMN05216386_0485 [Nitrosospira briensis]
MAKKSSASLTVVPPGVATLLSPPKSLTTRQKELWKEIVLSKPASWFDPSTAPLLSGYVKAIASHEALALRSDAIEATLDDGGDLKTLNRIHAMIERQARLIQTFATKLRLTQQSRYTAATAAVMSSKASGPRPWGDDK